MPSVKAGKFSALASGLEGYNRGVANRDTARMRKAQTDAYINKQNYIEETGSMQAQVDALKAQNEQLSKKASQNNVFSALRAYTSDFNTRHINFVIKNDDNMKRVMKDTASIDPIDVFNDIHLIRDAGLDPALFKENPELMDDEDKAVIANASGRYLKQTLVNGDKQILDMQRIYASTGYAKSLNDQDLAELLKRTSLEKKLRSGKGSGPTALQRNAKAAAEAKGRLDAGKGNLADAELWKGWTKEKAGVTPGKHDEAAVVSEKLVNYFGGHDKFMTTDFSDTKSKDYAYAYREVAKIEDLEGNQLDVRTKSDLHDIRELLSLGTPGSSLTDKETGWMDRFFMTTKKYMTDDVGGVAATSAYYTFRNSVRKALSGQALTEAEIKSFNDAFGTLGQKLGPVIQQFKTAITQVKAKFESIARMQNPYSAHVRLGIDQQQLDKVLSELDKRLELMQTGGVTAPIAPESKDLKGLGGKVVK